MAQVRLTRTGAIILVVFLTIVSFGIGFGVWKITGLPNLSPTDSSAGVNGCGGTTDKKKCESSCSPKKNGTSYKCTWSSANNKCRESSKACNGSNVDLCAGIPVVNDNIDSNGKNRCVIGSQLCQEDTQGKNTGFLCTCQSFSTTGCWRDWNCQTQNTKKCPTDVVAPVAGGCGSIVGGCMKLAEPKQYNVWTCPGMSYEEGKANGCQENRVTKTGSTACPGVSSNFCGWVQIDVVGPSCFRSWYFPCDEKDDKPSNSCEGGGLISQANISNAEVGDSVTFRGYAYDADGINTTISILVDGVAVGNATVVDACGASGDATICSTYTGRHPVIWSYVYTVTSGAHTLRAVWKDGKGLTGAKCVANAALTGTVVQGDWSVSKAGGQLCLNRGTENAQVRMDYIITVTNSSSTSQNITRIVDTLDSDIQESYIRTSSISPSASVSGNVITWTLTGADATFAAGQTKTFRYSVLLPVGVFGTYTNTALIYPESVTTPIEVDESVLASCDAPDTGLFDTTIGRITLGVMIFVIGLAYLYYDPFTGVVNKLYVNTLGPIFDNRIKVGKDRKNFERKVVKK